MKIYEKHATNEQIMEILKNDVKLIANHLILKNQIVETEFKTHEKNVTIVQKILVIIVKHAVEIE
jgi:hypothetical protein